MASREMDRLHQLIGLIANTEGWRAEIENGQKRSFIHVVSPQIESVKIPLVAKPTTASLLQFKQRVKQIGFDWDAAEEAEKDRLRKLKEEQKQAAAAEERRQAQLIRLRQEAAERDEETRRLDEAARKPRSNVKARRYTTTMKLTPEWCLPYLTERAAPQGRDPRPVDPDLVKRYVQDIADGVLADCVTPVMIDWDDYLLKGLHRLWAVFESGTPITCDVTFDVDPDHYDRLHTDPVPLTAVHGYTPTAPAAPAMPTPLQAALRMVHNYDNEPAAEWASTRTRLDASQLADVHAQNPGIDEAGTIARCITSTRTRAGMVQSAAQVFVHLALREWPEGRATLDDFLDGVSTGFELVRDDPRDALRQYLLTAGNPPPGQRRVSNAPEQLMVALKCWDAYCRREKMKRSSAAWTADENTVPTYTPAD